MAVRLDPVGMLDAQVGLDLFLEFGVIVDFAKQMRRTHVSFRTFAVSASITAPLLGEPSFLLASLSGGAPSALRRGTPPSLSCYPYRRAA